MTIAPTSDWPDWQGSGPGWTATFLFGTVALTAGQTRTFGPFPVGGVAGIHFGALSTVNPAGISYAMEWSQPGTVTPTSAPLYFKFGTGEAIDDNFAIAGPFLTLRVRNIDGVNPASTSVYLAGVGDLSHLPHTNDAIGGGATGVGSLISSGLVSVAAAATRTDTARLIRTGAHVWSVGSSGDAWGARLELQDTTGAWQQFARLGASGFGQTVTVSLPPLLVRSVVSNNEAVAADMSQSLYPLYAS